MGAGTAALFIAVFLACVVEAVEAVTIVLAVWDRLGWWSLAILTLAYAALTGYLIVRLRQELRNRRPLLAQTLAEVSKDREALFGHGAETGAEPKR